MNKVNRKLSIDDLDEKDTTKVIKRYIQREELKPYQAELIKMQRHLENMGKKMIVTFDGRDASGKGGTIRRVALFMNVRRYRVVALGKPNKRQRNELYIKRYIEQFPQAGEIVMFDRSWYNRAMVESVMGFCTPKQYKSFLKNINSYEANFFEDGKTILLKLYFSVSKAEQKRRFDRRKNDPLRKWKLSEVDLQAQELWDELTIKKYKMLKKTSTDLAPWWIIRSNDKHLARKETIKLILNSVPYHGRSRTLDMEVDPQIIRPAEKELKIMKKQKTKYGRFTS